MGRSNKKWGNKRDQPLWFRVPTSALINGDFYNTKTEITLYSNQYTDGFKIKRHARHLAIYGGLRTMAK